MGFVNYFLLFREDVVKYNEYKYNFVTIWLIFIMQWNFFNIKLYWKKKYCSSKLILHICNIFVVVLFMTCRKCSMAIRKGDILNIIGSIQSVLFCSLSELYKNCWHRTKIATLVGRLFSIATLFHRLCF